MSSLVAALTGTRGERVALTDVTVAAVLHDLLAEVNVSQTYRNDERTSIEAVYTFPLPMDAVLLDLAVEIGGRVLKGVVVEKKAAAARYEDALASGDGAVMLEALEPGLYTMNVGNLLPGEKATVRLRYAMLHHWASGRLRLMLPTTVAPRYGASPHAPHQAPESSLTVENQFSLTVVVPGNLRVAEFACPSHEVTLTRVADTVVISLQQPRAVMDRDFILTVTAPQAPRSVALSGPDGDGVAAIASFQPFFPGLRRPRPLNLAIVVDCSGSMQGDSIAQAKQAVAGILDTLQPQDRLTMIAFGNSTRLLSERLRPCDAATMEEARRFAGQLDADMGGTEVAGALRRAYAAVSDAGCADILLVTDGEVSAWEAVVDEAEGTGHRCFTVGVGSAVAEAFVRGLAAVTGGASELVAPREGMAERVVRHFERMRAPRARRVTVQWPAGAREVAPSSAGAVFEGDTVIASARFDQASIRGPVVLEVETEEGEVMRHEASISPVPSSGAEDRLSTMARLAASLRLAEQDARAGLGTALRYRLVSPWTSCLVVVERPEGEKSQDIPALRKVPQTLAAGWGGAGVVASHEAMMRSPASPIMAFRSVDGRRLGRADDLVSCARVADGRSTRGSRIPDPYGRLLTLVRNDPARLQVSGALGLLEDAGLASGFGDVFAHARGLGLDPGIIAAMILAELFDGPLSRSLPSGAERAVAELRRHVHATIEVLEEVQRRAHELRAAIEGARRLGIHPPNHVREWIETAEWLDGSLAMLAQWKARVRVVHAEIQAAREAEWCATWGAEARE